MGQLTPTIDVEIATVYDWKYYIKSKARDMVATDCIESIAGEIIVIRIAGMKYVVSSYSDHC